MAGLFKKMAIGLATTAVAATCFAGSGASVSAQTDASDLPEVQLISDQETIAAGGTLSYHILYHNVQNKNRSNVYLKVKLPAGVEAETEGLSGAEWDAQNRQLIWRLQGASANGTQVLHFNLTAHENLGDWLELSCQVEGDGSLKWETPKVKVKKGVQIDQPFFIGYPDGLFHPENLITRAEVAAVIAHIKKLEDASPVDDPYSDVPSGHWAYKVINKVSNAGYMGGYADGSFHPDDPISRAELVRLMLTLRGVKPIPLGGFDDTSDNWAKDAIGTAKSLGMIDGVGGGKFKPNGNTERQAAAKLLNVGLFRGPLIDGEMKVEQHFPDVLPGHWSFGWIEEASVVAHESLHKGRGREYLIRYLPEQTDPFE